MREDIIIRYAEAGDAAALGEIHALSWQAAYRGIIPDEVLDGITPQKWQACFEKALKVERKEDAVVFYAGQPVGFICFGKSRDADADSTCGEVWGIYLRPDFWRRGVGMQLMCWGLEELKKRGCLQATLWVLEDNHSARSFYDKMGFAFDGTVKPINIGKALGECRYRILL